MRTIILLIALLVPVSGWAATYYVSPTGSNTAPYDTWAKAANQASTVATAGNTDVGGDGPHRVYLAPGTYDGLVLNDSDWNSATIFGVSVGGFTAQCMGTGCEIYPANMGDVLLNSASIYPLRISNTGISASNLTVTGGKTLRLIYVTAADCVLNNIYGYDATSAPLLTNSGTNLLIKNSLFSGSGSNYALQFDTTGSGTIQSSIIRGSANFKSGTVASVYNVSSGTLSVQNTVINGGGGHGILQAGTGTTNVYNSLVSVGVSTSSVAVARSGGTLNLDNNYLVKPFKSPIPTSAISGTLGRNNNTYNLNGRAFKQSSKRGYVVIGIDDANVSHVTQLESIAASKGYGVTWWVTGEQWATIGADILAAHNRGVIKIAGHGYTHSSLSASGNLITLTRPGYTWEVQRNGVNGHTQDAIIVTDGGANTFTLSDFTLMPIGDPASPTSGSIIHWLVNTAGGTVGSLPANVYSSLIGESIADSNGPQVSGSALQLWIDTTGQRGYYNAEIRRAKILYESVLPGYTQTVMATPHGQTNVDFETTIKNLGFIGNRNTGDVPSIYLSSLNMYRGRGYIPGTDWLVGASDAETIANTVAMCEMISTHGALVYLYDHNDVSITNWRIILDVISEYGDNIIVGDQETVLRRIANEGVRGADCDDMGATPSCTYTRTFTDTSDYRLRPGSPCIKAGTPISGLTTDFAGKAWKNPPSIGAYEYYRKGGSGWGQYNFGFGW